ncbi:MAG TPA: MFS transporter [Legionella sp.]|nr:MFS transporter [Legionella sp.]
MRHPQKIMMAGLLGNLIEAFDMAMCGLLSVLLAKYLTSDAHDSVLIVLVTFFISFLARPIGAVILGLCSDIYGRKKTLAASILTMGLSTAMIGLIPSYLVIGFWALFFLLTLRTIQSLSCGAEYLNSASFLVESFDPVSSGYAGSWASFGATAGTLLASVLLLLMMRTIESYPETEWLLWRVPFAFALLGSIIGLFIRFSIPESKAYVLHYATQDKPRFTDLLNESFQYMRAHKTPTICVFLLSSLGVSITCLIYLFPSMQVNPDTPLTFAKILTSNMVSLTVMLCVLPLMGKLSDAFNRTHLIRYASLALLLLLYPFFYILHTGTFQALLTIQAVIAIPAALYYATVPAFFTEQFPIRLRCTALSLIYSVAASLSGGLVPIISLYLVKSTHHPQAPILIVLCLLMLTWAWMNDRQSSEPCY